MRNAVRNQSIPEAICVLHCVQELLEAQMARNCSRYKTTTEKLDDAMWKAKHKKKQKRNNIKYSINQLTNALRTTHFYSPIIQVKLTRIWVGFWKIT